MGVALYWGLAVWMLCVTSNGTMIYGVIGNPSVGRNVTRNHGLGRVLENDLNNGKCTPVLVMSGVPMGQLML